MDIREKIVAEAKTWLRTPYHHNARVKSAGVDCAQILLAVYEQVGLVSDVVLSPYTPDWHLHRSEEMYVERLTTYALQVETPEPGDIAVFKFGRCFAHGSIVVKWPLVIHAFMEDRQVSYGDATQGRLRDRPVKFFSVVPA